MQLRGGEVVRTQSATQRVWRSERLPHLFPVLNRSDTRPLLLLPPTSKVLLLFPLSPLLLKLKLLPLKLLSGNAIGLGGCATEEALVPKNRAYTTVKKAVDHTH